VQSLTTEALPMDALPFPTDDTPATPAAATAPVAPAILPPSWPCVLPDLPAAQYHRHPAASKHGLDDFRKAPALFRYKRDNPRESTSPALRFGSLYHTLLLEPDTLGSLYAVVPADAPKRPTSVQRNAKKPSLETLEAVAWWDNWSASNAGKEIVDAEDIGRAQAMRTAVMRHPAARAALTEHALHTEASMFWRDPETGVECRGRPDRIRTDGLIIDPKTCQDASPEAFQRAAWNYGYYRQAAFYCDAWQIITGEKPQAFVFIAQESEPPFLTAVYIASPQMIELGRAEIREDLRRFAECLSSDTWPGLPDQPQELTVPAWAMPKQA
jgi:hypothetical protein